MGSDFMLVSTSFLSSNNIPRDLKKLNETDTDYIHVDVMDGKFVPNKTMPFSEMRHISDYTSKRLDVHLMVKNVKDYINLYAKLNPLIITFHYEAVSTPLEIIDYIKSLNIKVGMSIKPSTKVEEIVSLLPYLDLVLVMSVEPGYGGQEFIYDSHIKINELDKIRKEKNYAYLIEVDGGVNDITSKLCKNADILVVGSFITDSENYQLQIEKIRKTLD